MHISETEVVALIAVAGTLGSGGLSYLASRRSTAVQLKAIQAEMERLKVAFTTAVAENEQDGSVEEVLKKAFTANEDAWSQAKRHLLQAMKEDIAHHRADSA